MKEKEQNVHYLGPRIKGTARRHPACGVRAKRRLVMTEEKMNVTCDRCVRTNYWHKGGALV